VLRILTTARMQAETPGAVRSIEQAT
jgi:hypothetical protein